MLLRKTLSLCCLAMFMFGAGFAGANTTRNGVQYHIAKAIQEQDIAAQEGGSIEPLQPVAPAPKTNASSAPVKKPTASGLAQRPMDESTYIASISPETSAAKEKSEPKKTKTDAGEGKNVSCTMSFSLESWSAFYKSGKGHGDIVCNNGEKARAAIRTHGGGITFGKSTVKGHAEFSKVHDINELFGSYASASAHAGAKKSADAQSMFKGKIGMKLAAKGEGWDLGFAFGSFNISRAR